MVASISIKMEKSPPKLSTKKRKKKTKSPVEAKSLRLDESPEKVAEPQKPLKQNAGVQEKKTECPQLSMEEIKEKYPVLMNEELVQKFLSVPMTNNQKGRIRQVLRDNLKGTSSALLPDVIHNRIQAVLKSATDLTDTDLRKIRILYNMLNTAVKVEMAVEKKSVEKVGEKKVLKVDKKKKEDDKPETQEVTEKKEKEQLVQKVKGVKRYVVFVGNLPPDIDKDKIKEHFSELHENIVDIRIPKRKPDSKSAIAYVELKNEPTYELALSKHHSMLANKRINVLYTTQKKSKVSKSEAKSKSAKLVALQKSGALIGSTPLSRRRSQRRNKMKKARKEQAE